MNHYTGLDVSGNTISVCIVNDKGEIVYENVIPTDSNLVDLELKNTKLSIASIGLKTGGMSNRLTRDLINLGWDVKCLDSFKTSKVISANTNKTDRNDARIIAEILRVNCFSSILKMDVPIKSFEAEDLKRVIDAHQTLVHARTQIYHAIKGVLKEDGIKLPTLEPEEFCKKVREVIKDLMPLLISSMNTLLETYIELSKQIDQMTIRLETIAAKNEDAKMLMTIPGINPITALCFLAVIDDPSRFKDGKAVEAYLGLTPKEYSSGQSKKGDTT